MYEQSLQGNGGERERLKKIVQWKQRKKLMQVTNLKNKMQVEDSLRLIIPKNDIEYKQGA